MPSGIGNSTGCDLPRANETTLPLSSARYPTPTMSSSFLKPCVTPRTALARSARARPCSARCSSLSRIAVSTPSFCSKRICRGTSTLSLPLGPCSSTLPPAVLIFTPAGTGMGLRPIRDMCCVFLPSISLLPRSTGAQQAAPLETQLPDLAKNLAADIGLARGAAGHQAFRRGQDADAEPADDRRDFLGPQVVALARARNALHAGDHAAAVRGVLEKDTQSLARLALLDQFVGRDVTLFLKNTGNLGFELRNRDVHALVLGGRGVANSGQKIGNGIRLHNFPISLLPARFHDSRDLSLESHAAETNAAHLELADIAAGAATDTAAIAHANLELGLLQGLGDFCGACHLLCGSFFAQGKTKALEQFASYFVVLRGGGKSDVHALDLVHARIVNFREHQLVLQAQGVIAAAIEGVGRQSAEVAHARQHHIAEPVEKFVHFLATQRDRAADGHAFADLEIRNGLLGAGDDGLLTGDLTKLDGGRVQQLDVLAGFAETDIDGDLLELGHRHDVLPAKALHQRRRGFLAVFFVQSTLHACPVPSKPYLSSVVPQRLQTRTLLPSGKTLWPTRACLLQLLQTIMTLETLMGASCATMPPLMFFAGLGRVCRLMMLACSTITVFLRGLMESTRPFLPASLPVITRTLSPLRTLMVNCFTVA